MAIYEGWRNQHTTLDAERAKNRIERHCPRCGTGIAKGMGGKRYCSPCSAERHDERLATQRQKMKEARS